MAWNLLDISALRSIELFDNVSDDALVEILSVASTDRYGKGEVLFQEGEPGEALFFILEGAVRISKDIHGIGEEALAILKAGSSFGEMALLDPATKRSAHAIADTECHIGKINRDDFSALLDADVKLANEFLSSFVLTLARRLRDSNEKVAFFALNDKYE
jgi:CRP/FNR family transcriptional regulator, cyclic AMP receptor protein